VSTPDVPSAIASPGNLLDFCEAITRAGLVGRFDAHCHLLVVESGAKKSRIPVEAPVGMVWWNGSARPERAYWLDVTGSMVPADARRGFQARAPAP
jgi:hypothetical protein